jgi:thioredoxin 1
METDKEILENREKKMNEFVSKQGFPDKPIEVSDDSFEGIIKKYPVVVMDFWSTTCPPCSMIAPILEELAGELRGEVVFGKVCLDEHREVASKFRIADTIVGLAPKEILLEKLKKHLG